MSPNKFKKTFYEEEKYIERYVSGRIAAKVSGHNARRHGSTLSSSCLSRDSRSQIGIHCELKEDVRTLPNVNHIGTFGSLHYALQGLMEEQPDKWMPDIAWRHR